MNPLKRCETPPTGAPSDTNKWNRTRHEVNQAVHQHREGCALLAWAVEKDPT